MIMTTTRKWGEKGGSGDLDGDEAPEASTAYHSTVLVLRGRSGTAGQEGWDGDEARNMQDEED